MDEIGDFLEHHGVRGQKWGIRRAKNVKRTSGDHRKVAELRAKRAHELTNRQLQDHNTRMNLVVKFNQMNPTKIDKGHAKVKSILAVVGTAATVANLANSPHGRAAIAAAKKTLKGSGKHFAP